MYGDCMVTSVLFKHIQTKPLYVLGKFICLQAYIHFQAYVPDASCI